MARTERLYRAILRVYPRRFRARFEADLEDAFVRDHARAQSLGAGATGRFWAATIGQTLWSGLAERTSFVLKGSHMKSALRFDWRDAMRSLRATPVVTAMAVLSLALGIGANTALFSILNGLVLKTLPVREPMQLVSLEDGSPGSDWTNPIWEEIRDRQNQWAAGVLAWGGARFNLSQQGQTDFVNGAYASGSAFRVLGVSAYRGRMLNEDDDKRGGGANGAVAVLSYGLWQKLGGSDDLMGSTLAVEHVPFTVVGVMAPGFVGPDVGRASDLVLPLADEALIRGHDSALDGHWTWWLEILARLKPDQTVEQATALVRGVQPQVREATLSSDARPEMAKGYLHEPFTLAPAATGLSPLRAKYQQPLTIIMIVVGAVLLVACANIANLLLTRATARRHELVIRLALGASRWRVARQLLLESALLAGVGAVLGLIVARFGSALLLQQLGSAVVVDTSLDWRVLAFTSAVTCSTVLLFGLAPALGISGMSPHEALKEQGRGVTGDRRFGFRHMLVVSQVALSLALVVAAGLFVRTLTTLMAVPLGFNPAPLTAVEVNVQRSVVPADQRPALFERFREAAASMPGVKSAGLSVIRPMSGSGWNTRVQVPGGPSLTDRERLSWMNGVTPGWFDTYGMRLVGGRDFTLADSSSAEAVAVVNQTFVHRFFGDDNPVGRQIQIDVPQSPNKPCTIVGVVADAVYRRPREGFTATMYVPLAQTGRLSPSLTLTIAARSGRPDALARDLIHTLGRADGAAAFTLRSFDDELRSTVAQERLVAILSAFFGGLALMLAGLGLYGVTSYAVTRRRTEIGVRMALGARSSSVARLVLGRVGWLVAVGIVIGAALSWWASRFVAASLLFGLDARDPGTFVVAAAVLAVVGVVAGWLPARRASRIDPVQALREG